MTKRKKDVKTNPAMLKIDQYESHKKTRGELGCCERVKSSYPAKGTRRVTLIKTPIVSHE